MADIKWIMDDKLINDLIIHTTTSSIRRAIAASVYKVKETDPLEIWYLKDEPGSPILPHVYIVDLMKYHLLATNQLMEKVFPAPEPTPPTPPVPPPSPYPSRSYLEWDQYQTGGPYCTCDIRGNMAIFDGRISYYNGQFKRPGNYVGINIFLESNPFEYPNFKVQIRPSHACDRVLEFGHHIVHRDHTGRQYIHWFPQVSEAGEEFRLLILWNGEDGGPRDPFTESIIIAVTEESTLLTR